MSQIYRAINIEASKCTGCRMCELACALKKEGAFNPARARIRAVSIPPMPFYGVVTCLQCAEPPCAQVCPTAALNKDGGTGLVNLIEERCVGCMLCLAACPFGGIFFSSERNVAYKCDHCEGDPQCVAVCAPGCLTYTDHGPTYLSLSKGPDLLSPGTSACQGCSVELALRHTFRILGQNSIVGFSPG